MPEVQARLAAIVERFAGNPGAGQLCVTVPLTAIPAMSDSPGCRTERV